MLYPKPRTNSKCPILVITVFCDTCAYLLIIDMLKLTLRVWVSVVFKGDFTTKFNSSRSTSMTVGDLGDNLSEDQTEDFYS